MNSRVQQILYKQLSFGPRKGLRIIRDMRQAVGRRNPTRLSTPGAGWIAVLFLVVGVSPSTLSAVEPTIHGAWLGPEVMYTQVEGDTWYATWADDGDLYVTSDDTNGLSANCSTKNGGAWLAVNRLQGDDPAHLKGETVNCMGTYVDPPDPKIPFTNWKATGIFVVDDTLYLVVDQETYIDVGNLGKQST